MIYRRSFRVGPGVVQLIIAGWLAGAMVALSLAESQATDPAPRNPNLKLDLSIVRSGASSYPSQFIMTLTNRSDHTIVGGNLRLLLIIGDEHPSMVIARAPEFSWGEFRLRQNEVSVRTLAPRNWVIKDHHDKRWDADALRALLERSRWSVVAVAADESDQGGGESWSERYLFDSDFEARAQP